MPTRVLPFGDAAIAEAAALIDAGDVVAVPTETVYGLAGDATNDRAVAAIYAAKGRPGFNPLIVHVADLAQAEQLAEFDDAARALAAAHWPGPLTLVLPRRTEAGLAAAVTAGLPTVAIRIPAHRAMQALLAATARPLAAPSANASGTISPTRAEHVLRSLDGRIRLIVDDGATSGGIESTIIGFSNRRAVVLRPGPLFGDHERASDAEITAPGQLAAHYAPSKPLRLDVKDALAGEWHIGFGDVAGDVSLSITGDLAEAAARLFHLLHDADVRPAARIAVAPIPHRGIGVAINDRLQRAAVGSGAQR